MNQFRWRISLGVISEMKETEFLREILLPFVPQLGTSIQLLGMDFESNIVHVSYVEHYIHLQSSFNVSLDVQNLNQHQINQLIENGWKRES